MSGQDAIRGFLYQTLIAILESLNKDWSTIRIEPHTENDKVDIMWSYANSQVHACQVKSSINIFSKGDILSWLHGLQSDMPDAEKYSVLLIGTTSPETQKYFNHFSEKSNDTIPVKYKSLLSIKSKVEVKFYPLNIDTMRGDIISKIFKFLSINKINLEYFTTELIADGLLNQFLHFSTSGKQQTKQQFESKLLEWVRYNYNNQISSNHIGLSLKFYKTNTINFCDEISGQHLSTIDKSEYFSKKLNNVKLLFKELCSYDIVENESSEEDSFLTIPKFQLPSLIISSGEEIEYFIDKYDRESITKKIRTIIQEDVPKNFFAFGTLKKRKNNFPSLGSFCDTYTFIGTTEEKEKQEKYEQFKHELIDLDDLVKYWQKIRELQFLPIVLCNNGNAYQQQIKIRLKIPKNINVIRPNTFPIPKRYQIIKDFNSESGISYHIRHHKDSNVNEYQTTNFLSANFELRESINFQNDARYDLQVERYYEVLEYFHDYEIFDDRKNETVIQCEIPQLNLNESISLPTFICLKNSSSFNIDYEINSKNQTQLTQGTLTINN